MAKLTLRVNGQSKVIDVDPQMPLLWAIRDFIKLTGTKFGCGIGQCGACIVQLDGKPVRSCVIPSSAVIGKEVMTIEGLSKTMTMLFNLPGYRSRYPNVDIANRVRS